MLEKPLAGNLAEACEIVALSQEKGLPITTGHTLRYSAVIGRLKKELPRLGQLLSFSANQHLEPTTLK